MPENHSWSGPRDCPAPSWAGGARCSWLTCAECHQHISLLKQEGIFILLRRDGICCSLFLPQTQSFNVIFRSLPSAQQQNKLLRKLVGSYSTTSEALATMGSYWDAAGQLFSICHILGHSHMKLQVCYKHKHPPQHIHTLSCSVPSLCVRSG